MQTDANSGLSGDSWNTPIFKPAVVVCFAMAVTP